MNKTAPMENYQAELEQRLKLYPRDIQFCHNNGLIIGKADFIQDYFSMVILP